MLLSKGTRSANGTLGSAVRICVVAGSCAHSTIARSETFFGAPGVHVKGPAVTAPPGGTSAGWTKDGGISVQPEDQIRGLPAAARKTRTVTAPDPSAPRFFTCT